MQAVRKQWVLALILAVYLSLGIGYSLTTPLFEASDELSHYPLVQHLAASGLRLPVQNPAEVALWKQEGGQPPLYYFLAALATSRIDTSDFFTVYQLNPHADIGIVPPDGNVNMAVHAGEQAAFPWRGTALAVHVARLLSVLMGAITVLTTYLIGREVLPAQPGVALVAAALNALLPMFLFISGSVNNDNLSNMLAGLLLWRVMRLLRRSTLPGWGELMAIGLLAGAALLAKLSLGFLLLFVAGAFVNLSVRLRSWRPVLVGGAVSGGVAILVAGWWYARNWQLYGDLTGLNVFLDIVGRRAVRANAAQLLTEQESFFRSWWGAFGGMNVLYPAWVYSLFNAIGLIGILGFGLYAVLWLRGRLPDRWRADGPALLMLAAWPVVAFISLLSWTSITWASQGRLLFIAIGPVSCWLAIGLGWWLPRWPRRAVWLLAIALFGLAALLTPPLVIRPAYTPPALDAGLPASLPGAVHTFYVPGATEPILRLRGYELLTETARPGEQIDLRLHWEVTRQPDQRWSLFVHVLDGVDVIAAQRDRYPGRGLLATEALQAGQAWSEQVTVALPEGLYAPDTLRVMLGFYNRATGERLLLEPGGESMLPLGSVLVLPRDPAAAIPNPRTDDFAGQFALRGYEVSGRWLRPGDPLEVSLYWEAQGRPERDYTVFVHLIDIPTLSIYAGSDARPSLPTSTWRPGEIIVDTHLLTLSPETPPGTYDLEVGLYWMPEDGVFERLEVRSGRGGQTADVVYLSRIRVDPLAVPGMTERE
ncbi:MAG: hypothetical protein JXN59_13930 [Anaerolineae bacterium]|nr:hypothetical protein [Anaerolineae bacterium]